MYMPCLQSPEEGTVYPETGVRDYCEFLCRCWNPNLGPLARAASALNLLNLHKGLEIHVYFFFLGRSYGEVNF